MRQSCTCLLLDWLPAKGVDETLRVQKNPLHDASTRISRNPTLREWAMMPVFGHGLNRILRNKGSIWIGGPRGQQSDDDYRFNRGATLPFASLGFRVCARVR